VGYYSYTRSISLHLSISYAFHFAASNPDAMTDDLARLAHNALTMLSNRAQNSMLLVGTMLGVVMIAAMSACDTSQSLPAAPAMVNPSDTAVGTANATIIPTSTDVPYSPTEDATVSWQEFKAGAPSGWLLDPIHAAVATELVIWNNQHQTAIALTPISTEVPYTPEPTATLGVGLIADVGCVHPIHDGKPQFPSCGEAYVNGTWLFVGAGYTGGGIGAYNPPPQSLLVVCPEPLDEHWGGSDALTYETPVNVGEIRIEALSGSLVTVVPRDPNNHVSFVFDLATRQWINLRPTPSPSP
jgi:hypothetical protein